MRSRHADNAPAAAAATPAQDELYDVWRKAKIEAAWRRLGTSLSAAMQPAGAAAAGSIHAGDEASWGGKRWRWTGTRWTPEGLALPLSQPSILRRAAEPAAAAPAPHAIPGRAAARRIHRTVTLASGAAKRTCGGMDRGATASVVCTANQCIRSHHTSTRHGKGPLLLAQCTGSAAARPTRVRGAQFTSRGFRRRRGTRRGSGGARRRRCSRRCTSCT